jgi:hypothetical protein
METHVERVPFSALLQWDTGESLLKLLTLARSCLFLILPSFNYSKHWSQFTVYIATLCQWCNCSVSIVMLQIMYQVIWAIYHGKGLYQAIRLMSCLRTALSRGTFLCNKAKGGVIYGQYTTAKACVLIYHKPLMPYCYYKLVTNVITAVKIHVLSYLCYMVWYTTAINQSAFRAQTIQFIRANIRHPLGPNCLIILCSSI